MDWTWWQYLLLAGAGFLAGGINVMAGGGSLLTLPLMVFMGVPGATANGSNRIAIFFQTLTSAITFYRRGISDLKLSLSLAAVALPGAVIGALAGTRIEGPWFNRVLAVVMIMVLIAMRTQKGVAPVAEEPLSRSRFIAGHACMFGVGLYVGFIQAGAGFLFMAVLHRILRIDLVRVNMHKMTIAFIITIASLIVYALNGKILWTLGLVLAVGNASGAWVATHASVDHGETLIRKVLVVAIVVMAARLLWTSFG